MTTSQTLFDSVGGEDVFNRIVHGFYTRMRSDDLIGPMYPSDDWEGAEDRLRMFLVQYWAGRVRTANSVVIRACACATCRFPSAKPNATAGWRS